MYDSENRSDYVPILLPPEVTSALDCLLKVKTLLNIDTDRPFLLSDGENQVLNLYIASIECSRRLMASVSKPAFMFDTFIFSMHFTQIIHVT